LNSVKNYFLENEQNVSLEQIKIPSSLAQAETHRKGPADHRTAEYENNQASV
jgi:hypothetical protein